MRRSHAYAVVGLVAAAPRLGALLVERGDILASFVEKSDVFARTFVASGTYGLIPDQPSAYTQPLYGFFLIPIYWIFGHSWLALGLAQIGLAVLTALLVYELGRRLLGSRAGIVAALVATLQPYLIWHDVHVNREIVDQPLAVATVLAFVALKDRAGLRLAALSGGAAGLAILGNARLAGLPLVLLAWLLWQAGTTRRTFLAGAVVLVATAAVIAPWAIRNEVQVGCFAITTDSRALWKANNPLTYDLLASGRWIDEVPDIAGAPPTPSAAADIYTRTGRRIHVDECAQMAYYRGLVTGFWADEPGEKARLSGQAARMLWDPRTTATEDRPGQGTWLDVIRQWPQALYFLALVALAVAGARRHVPRAFVWLTVVVLAYGTLAAMVFVGATRYRAPWDFMLAVLAAPALVRGWDYLRSRAAR